MKIKSNAGLKKIIDIQSHILQHATRSLTKIPSSLRLALQILSMQARTSIYSGLALRYTNIQLI